MAGRGFLSAFFKFTGTAALAFYGDFKFKPYYNVFFHLDALTTFLCHITRCLYDLACAALRVVITPFYVLNPLAWIWLPGHTMELLDDLVGVVISAATVIVHPLVFTIRTLASVIFGYEEGTDCDWGVEGDEQDLDLAMTIGAFS